MLQYTIVVEEIVPYKEGKVMGLIKIVRNVSQLLQYLTVFPQSRIMSGKELFFAMINGIPLETKTRMLTYYINNNVQEPVAIDALKQNIIYTLCNEMEANLAVREKKLASFPWLTYYSNEIIKQKEENKDFNYKLTEDIFIKISEFTEQTAAFFDNIIFIRTHASIHRQMSNIVENLSKRVYKKEQAMIKEQEKL